MRTGTFLRNSSGLSLNKLLEGCPSGSTERFAQTPVRVCVFGCCDFFAVEAGRVCFFAVQACVEAKRTFFAAEARAHSLISWSAPAAGRINKKSHSKKKRARFFFGCGGPRPGEIS